MRQMQQLRNLISNELIHEMHWIDCVRRLDVLDLQKYPKH